MKLILVLLFSLFLLAGCALSPMRMLDAETVDALSRNTNSLYVEIVTVQGTVRIYRNMTPFSRAQLP